MGLIDNMDKVFPAQHFQGNAPPQKPQKLAQFGVAGWYENEETHKFTDREVGWAQAAGWVISGDAELIPGTANRYQYPCKRKKLKQNEVVTDLIQEYVNAFNDGRNANQSRYEEVWALYNDTVLQSQAHMNHAGDAHQSYETLFLTSLDSVVQQIDSQLNATKTHLAAVFDDAADKLNDIAAGLFVLGANMSAYQADITTILAGQTTTLGTFTARNTATLASLSNDYTTLSAAITDLESTSETDRDTFIGEFEAHVDVIDGILTATETELLGLVDEATAAYSTYETNVNASVSDIEGELTTFYTAISDLMDEMDTQTASHKATYSSLLALYLSDYNTHAAKTRALLTDLGTTELARINEAYDNDLANKTQLTTDRGFNSSLIITNLTTRNTRERDERIAQHNDNLAREQVDHEHKLYGELTTVRDKNLAGDQYKHQLETIAIEYRAKWTEGLFTQTLGLNKTTSALRRETLDMKQRVITMEEGVRNRLYEWEKQLKLALAESERQIHAIRQEITRFKTDNDYKRNDFLQNVRKMSSDLHLRDFTAELNIDEFQKSAVEGVQDRMNAYVRNYVDSLRGYSSSVMQNGQVLASVRNACSAQAMQTRFKYCAGINDANMAEQQLFEFQIDERNNICSAMFRFMENRTDNYPGLESVTNVIMGLGDGGSFPFAVPE